MDALTGDIASEPCVSIFGRLVTVRGMLLEIAGPVYGMKVGSRLTIPVEGQEPLDCEVIGFRDNLALCLPFRSLEGVRMGSWARIGATAIFVRPSAGWLGRVVNAMGAPVDGKGPLPLGSDFCNLRNRPPPAHQRGRVGGPLDLGVRVLNTFVTCCRGQRMGIFSGSGVGKSVLLSMLARNTDCDVSIIALIGERGREVQEFIKDDLGEEGLRRSIVVVATSDEAALMRRQAAYLTLTLSEYFRDQGKDVLCLIDSLTRFAMAQREIGLSVGEPPTTKGYTPTVFSELPQLLERAGPGVCTEAGSITGLFTILVEGDDHNEPIADAARGILDGHIVMERAIAERGRYPAVNVLRSLSRMMPGCVDEQWWDLLRDVRRLMAGFSDMEDLIRVGAYRKGSDPTVDLSIRLNDLIEPFLNQKKNETTTFSAGYKWLTEIMLECRGG
ncbi:MAG: flagellar protein export ATPase FliI [Alphaproteobacteria bacterium]|nr:flagellar protein export ATPase FliI [Alphaproteobacteria bacterium]